MLVLIFAIPVAMIVITLLVLALVNVIKKVKLNNQIRRTIYNELVSRASDKSPKELEEYMKIIKKY